MGNESSTSNNYSNSEGSSGYQHSSYYNNSLGCTKEERGDAAEKRQ